MPRDYYEVLGVPRTAGDREIRAAFRRLARKHHPDVNPGQPGAADRFKEINEAYEVLSQPETRRLYDRHGHAWKRAQQFGNGSRPGGGGGPFTWRAEGFGPGAFDDLFRGGLGEVFDRYFGGGARTRTRASPQAAVEQPVEVTLEEAFAGATRSLQVTGQRACIACGGAGAIAGAPCHECLGQGFSFTPVRGQVTVPAGVDSGSRVRVSAGGQEVVLTVQVRPHPRFQRKGADLHTEVSVSLYDAMLGGEVVVPTLRGRVAMTLPPETQNGRVFRLSGQGMPHLGNPSARGDLLVTVRVELPSGLSEEEREALRRLRDLHRRQGGAP